MTEDMSRTRGFVIVIFTIAIAIGAFAFTQYLKDIDVIDTYGDFSDKLRADMRTWDCEKLLDWAYADPLFGGMEQQAFAKQLAKQKCLQDEEWLNPPQKTVKEPPPTMDELYASWKSKTSEVKDNG